MLEYKPDRSSSRSKESFCESPDSFEIKSENFESEEDVIVLTPKTKSQKKKDLIFGINNSRDSKECLENIEPIKNKNVPLHSIREIKKPTPKFQEDFSVFEIHPSTEPSQTFSSGLPNINPKISLATTMNIAPPFQHHHIGLNQIQQFQPSRQYQSQIINPFLPTSNFASYMRRPTQPTQHFPIWK